MPEGTIPSLAAAHLRLGRAAVGIYSAASAIALSLLLATLFTEHSHTQDELKKQVLPLFEVPAAEAAVQLDLSTSQDPVWVSADPQLLRIALSNLLNNALDALSARRPNPEPARIELRVEGTPGSARLLVSDNGDGVLDEIRPRLFEPFQSGKTSGVGIGLALGKRIAQAHGGDLELSSYALGAKFCLTLPRESA